MMWRYRRWVTDVSSPFKNGQKLGRPLALRSQLLAGEELPLISKSAQDVQSCAPSSRPAGERDHFAAQCNSQVDAKARKKPAIINVLGTRSNL
jgi:hypothetical protein